MLNTIKAYPGHPDSPAWLKEMRDTVNSSAPSTGTTGQ
jgi:hypothetical protein